MAEPLNIPSLHALLVDPTGQYFSSLQTGLGNIPFYKIQLDHETSIDIADKHIDNNQYNLVFVELTEHSDQGLAFLKRSTQHQPDQKPIIAITPQQHHDTTIAALKNGASDVIHPPYFSAKALSDVVRSAMQKYKSTFSYFARQNLYHNLFYQSPDGQFVLDTNMHLEKVNKSFCYLLGCETDALKGKPFDKLFSDQAAFKQFANSLQSNGIATQEVKWHHASGEIRYYTITCNTIAGTLKSFGGFQGKAIDITERRIEEKTKELDQKYNMTNRLSRMIAHEVRNPLTNINLALKQISGDQQDASLKNYTDIIQRSSDRINRLISAMLSASSPSAIDRKPIALPKLVKQAFDNVQDRAKLRNIKLRQEIESDLPPITLDAERMGLALTNLLINATEAISHPNGEIVLKARKVRNQRIEICVQDNGSGMSEQTMAHLYEPFFTSKKGGTGLGLAAAMNIIRAHDGQMHCDSKEGNGTTFTITLAISAIEKV